MRAATHQAALLSRSEEYLPVVARLFSFARFANSFWPATKFAVCPPHALSAVSCRARP